MALTERYPVDCVTVTYETLLRGPEPALAGLFRFLGVSDSDTIVADCLTRTAFSKMTGGRSAGIEQSGSFFRKGVAGGWSDTLTAEMNAMILRELGWMFSHFGWRIRTNCS